MAPPDSKKPWENKILKAWGESALPPMAVSSLILAQSVRPVRWLGLIFPPILTFSAWSNVMGAKVDSAGITGGWSLLYIMLTWKKRIPWEQRYQIRGLLRYSTIGTCWANVFCCGYVYVKKKGFRLNTPDIPT